MLKRILLYVLKKKSVMSFGDVFTQEMISWCLCPVLLKQSAERCVSTLLDLIQTKVNYVVQEAIVVIRDIFRKYPNKYVRCWTCQNCWTRTIDKPVHWYKLVLIDVVHPRLCIFASLVYQCSLIHMRFSFLWDVSSMFWIWPAIIFKALYIKYWPLTSLQYLLYIVYLSP